MLNSMEMKGVKKGNERGENGSQITPKVASTHKQTLEIQFGELHKVNPVPYARYIMIS